MKSSQHRHVESLVPSDQHTRRVHPHKQCDVFVQQMQTKLTKKNMFSTKFQNRLLYCSIYVHCPLPFSTSLLVGWDTDTLEGVPHWTGVFFIASLRYLEFWVVSCCEMAWLRLCQAGDCHCQAAG